MRAYGVTGALTFPCHLVECPAPFANQPVTRLLEGGSVQALYIHHRKQDVDRILRQVPLRFLYPEIAARRPSTRTKDLHDIEVASAALHERHVVQKAPVLQHGCTPLRLVRYALDGLLPHVVLPLIHSLVPLSYAAERYNEHRRRNAHQGGHPQLRGNPSSQTLRALHHARYTRRDKDGQDEVSGNVENVDVPDAVFEGV